MCYFGVKYCKDIIRQMMGEDMDEEAPLLLISTGKGRFPKQIAPYKCSMWTSVQNTTVATMAHS